MSKGNGNSLITARDIVRKYQLTYQTLNFYTSIGLFSVVKKDANQRLYKEPDVRERLKKIGRLKDKGYPLNLIRQVLSSKQRVLA